MIKNIFPILNDLSDYSLTTFKSDFFAGITVGVLLIPQGMAYALLAGMPPIYGLYGGLLPILIYALLGTSKQLAIGPVAISSLLILVGVGKLSTPFTEEYIAIVIALGLLVGVLQFFIGFIRFGFLANFISYPLIIGFTSAAAIIIAISQLKDLFGMSIPRFEQSYETLYYAVTHLAQVNWLTFLVCGLSIVLMLVLKRINKAIPHALIAVVVATLASYYFHLEHYGVALIAEVPKGIPSFQLPTLNFELAEELLPTILSVAIIGIVECISIAKVLESKNGNYTIDPNRELIAVGLANIGGSFFQALPSSASFTRSAVNNEAGAKTTVAGFFTLAIVAFTLLFFTELFYYLPKAILAGVIILAVRNLFEFSEGIYLFKTNKRDFYVMLFTFLATLGLGIETGIALGVILAVGTVLLKSVKPRVIVLGRVEGQQYYRNIERIKTAKEIEGLLILRFENQLYFANAPHFKENIKRLVSLKKYGEIHTLLLDAKSIYEIDSTGLRAIKELAIYLKRSNISLIICGALEPVRNYLEVSGVMEEIGQKEHFLFLHDAVLKNQ